MNDVTFILNQLEQGDDAAAEPLLELVYDELQWLPSSIALLSLRLRISAIRAFF